MNKLSYKRCVTVLLIVLTQKFATIFAGDITWERKTLAKVLTSFLKVPWINVNSSWTNAEASTCRNDIETVFNSADVGEMWALQMLDATSKVPAGILFGNILELGMFDECVNIKSDSNLANIQGQHCIISLSMPTKFFEDSSEMMRIQKLNFYNPSADVDLSLSLSVCAPSSCGTRDINDLVNASIRNIPELISFEVGVAEVVCSSFESSVEFTLGSILTLTFFAMVVLLLLFCTACDFVVRTRSSNGSMMLKNAAKFSFYTNALKLTATKVDPDGMPAIHGMRVLNMCLIVLVHRSFNALIKPTVNMVDTYKSLKSVMSSFIFTLFFVDDTFFLMSGFLMAYLFLKRMRSGAKLNVFELYLHRYIRLTPCLAVVILFVIFIIPHLVSGPIWEKVFKQTVVPCQKNWWTNLLYVQNVVNADQMCLLHSWFLAAEMQMFWLSPIILYPLYHWPKLGLSMLGLLLTTSFLVPTVQIVVNNWSAIFGLNKSLSIIFAEFIEFFPITYNRALPYLIGILLGYEVSKKRRHISELQVTVNWILACVLVICSGWIVHHIQPHGVDYNVVWEAIYVSVGRLAWSLAMAWAIYACSQGYGGPATTFLSLPVFAPLSRLSYSIYLVHFVLQVATTASQRTADYMTPFSVIYLMWGDLALSIVIAFVVSLCFESPIIILEKILRSGRSSASTKHDSIAMKETLSASVKKYSDITTGQVNSDSLIKTITLKIDFWQTISAELKMLSELPPKTPAEWSKMWEYWQSKLSKIKREYEFQSKSIRKNGLQQQTSTTVLAEELIVFIAAVNGGFTDNTSLKNSNIKRAKSLFKLGNQNR